MRSTNERSNIDGAELASKQAGDIPNAVRTSQVSSQHSLNILQKLGKDTGSKVRF